jgi:glycosyltransferase involved in cell wall biosynthesis
MAMDKRLLSIVVPIYNEQENLLELRRRLKAVIGQLPFRAAEVLLVSDGSTDQSESIIREYVEDDPRFQGIFLTRNFGHQAAVSIGLAEAQGTVVAVIDGDLQDPPEAIVRLIGGLEEGADVAYGVRRKRKEGLFKRAAYGIFYRSLKWVSSIDIPLDSGDFCCMRRPVVDAIVRLPERNRFIRGLRAWVGYTHVGVEYERSARYAGEPKYTLRKLLGLAYDGYFSFSNMPTRLMQFVGFALSAMAILVAAAYIGVYFMGLGQFPRGFATLVVSIWFLSGVQLFSLGILGEYISRIADETRHRPVALVREVVKCESTSCHPDEVLVAKPTDTEVNDQL